MVLLFGPFQTGRKISLTDELTMMGWRGLCRSLSGFLGDDHVVHRFDVTSNYSLWVWMSLFMDLRTMAPHRFLSHFFFYSVCYPGEILVRVDNLFVECVGIDVPEVIYFSGEYVRYTLTRLQTLNAT